METNASKETQINRLASPSEDESDVRILCNAFLYNWDINWWQSRRSHLPPVTPTPSLDREAQTSAQRDRLNFYRTIVRLVRLIGGNIFVAIPQDGSQPGAMLCWLPPGVEVTAYAILRSGLLFALLRLGRLMGTWNFLYFELKLSDLYDHCLRPLGRRSRHEGALVQIIGTDPAHAGNRLSAELLRWQIERYRQECVTSDRLTPVFLDTAGDYQQHVYEQLGFRALGKQKLRVDVNEGGLKAEISQDFFLRAMMLDLREGDSR